MTGTIYIFNGPNLNLLGEREPEVYGRDTLADVEAMCRAVAEPAGYALELRQSNSESEIVEWFQGARTGAAGIVFNPAAFSYASYPILDAIKLVDCPVIEVHISNIYRRAEVWRAKSIISQVATATLSGLGVQGYALAVAHIIWLKGREK